MEKHRTTPGLVLKLGLVMIALFLSQFPSFALKPQQPLLPVGSVAPDFTGIGLDGKPIHLSDFKGKFVVVDFWASWCPPCNEEMPGIEDLHERYKDTGVVVVGLNVWDTADAAYAWIKSHPQYTFTFAFDPGGKDNSQGDKYHVWGIPTTYVIDPSGYIVFDGVVAQEPDLISAIDQALLNASSPPAINDGEIMIYGKISKAYDGKSAFELSVSSVTTQDENTTRFDTARQKTIIVNDQTPVTNVGQTGQLTDLAQGTPVYVVGHDQGPGKPLTARTIAIPFQH